MGRGDRCLVLWMGDGIKLGGKVKEKARCLIMAVGWLGGVGFRGDFGGEEKIVAGAGSGGGSCGDGSRLVPFCRGCLMAGLAKWGVSTRELVGAKKGNWETQMSCTFAADRLTEFPLAAASWPYCPIFTPEKVEHTVSSPTSPP